jgi:hypothetical protein
MIGFMQLPDILRLARPTAVADGAAHEQRRASERRRNGDEARACWFMACAV